MKNLNYVNVSIVNEKFQNFKKDLLISCFKLDQKTIKSVNDFFPCNI